MQEVKFNNETIGENMSNTHHEQVVSQSFNFLGKEFLYELIGHQPSIICEGNRYETIDSLLKAYPALTRIENLTIFSRSLNFLTVGIDYQYIEDIVKFQNAYQAQVDFEKNSFDYIPMRITNHGIFNITEMTKPHIVNHSLVFYVKNVHNGLPYRVTYLLTNNDKNLPLYQLLPYAID